LHLKDFVDGHLPDHRDFVEHYQNGGDEEDALGRKVYVLIFLNICFRGLLPLFGEVIVFLVQKGTIRAFEFID
jgi:hypothetical protein